MQKYRNSSIPFEIFILCDQKTIPKIKIKILSSFDSKSNLYVKCCCTPFMNIKRLKTFFPTFVELIYFLLKKDVFIIPPTLKILGVCCNCSLYMDRIVCCILHALIRFHFGKRFISPNRNIEKL